MMITAVPVGAARHFEGFDRATPRIGDRGHGPVGVLPCRGCRAAPGSGRRRDVAGRGNDRHQGRGSSIPRLRSGPAARYQFGQVVGGMLVGAIRRLMRRTSHSAKQVGSAAAGAFTVGSWLGTVEVVR